MTTEPVSPDEPEVASDVPGAIDIRPWSLIRKHGLKPEQPLQMGAEEIQTFRDRFATAIGRHPSPPGTVAESSTNLFEQHFGIRLDQLVDGYFDRRPDGVEIVLYGTNADERTVWLVLAIGFDGNISVSKKTEVLPSDGSNSPLV